MGLTSEQYKIAESNGISRQLAYARIDKLNWDIERAITDPLTKSTDEYLYWKNVGLENGLTYIGFRKRIKKGMSLEMAATLSKQAPGRKKDAKEYIVYKGENFICMGTVQECAEYMEILETTFRFYLSQSYRNRIAERKRTKGNYITVTELEDEEDE